MKLYLKDGIVFSDLTQDFFVFDSFLEIKHINVPSEIKNHLIQNKILYTDLEKLKKFEKKKFKISKPIENWSSVSSKLKKIKKNELVLPHFDDYVFIEKTSQIEILQSIIDNLKREEFDFFKDRIENYVLKVKTIEKEKIALVEEQILVEKNQLKELKKNYEKEVNVDLENKILKLKNQKEKFELQVENLMSAFDDEEKIELKKQEFLRDKIDEIMFKIKNVEIEKKVLKAQITDYKSQIKFGKRKCFNKITIILMFFTLGLIYWSRFTDIKYYLNRAEDKINKLNSNLVNFEKEKFLVEKDLSDLLKLKKVNDEKNSEKIEINKKMIKELNKKLEKIDEEISSLESEASKFEKVKDSYNKKFEKIELKISELNSTRDEFLKYSSLNIKNLFSEITNENNLKIKELHEILNKIKSQKIDISGEYIVEILD